MKDEYVRKQDAKEKIHNNLNYLYAYGTDRAPELIDELEPVSVVPVEILKAEIYKLKCQQDSKNQDYYAGYVSALSTVEGILAETGEG